MTLPQGGLEDRLIAAAIKSGIGALVENFSHGNKRFANRVVIVPRGQGPVPDTMTARDHGLGGFMVYIAQVRLFQDSLCTDARAS